MGFDNWAWSFWALGPILFFFLLFFLSWHPSFYSFHPVKFDLVDFFFSLDRPPTFLFSFLSSLFVLPFFSSQQATISSSFLTSFSSFHLFCFSARERWQRLWETHGGSEARQLVLRDQESCEGGGLVNSGAVLGTGSWRHRGTVWPGLCASTRAEQLSW